jgi:hypothetical protein
MYKFAKHCTWFSHTFTRYCFLVLLARYKGNSCTPHMCRPIETLGWEHPRRDCVGPPRDDPGWKDVTVQLTRSMNQFRSVISQYANNAAERVACHYKKRSLTFRIVARRLLSRAPSSPPPDSIRPAAHSICRRSLRMATPQQKVFCVLEFARANSVVTVQRAFRRFNNVQ